ncbi:MAG: hypothetical protein AB1797_08245 [bacterium]
MSREKVLDKEAILIENRITIAPGLLSQAGEIFIQFFTKHTCLLSHKKAKLNIKHANLRGRDYLIIGHTTYRVKTPQVNLSGLMMSRNLLCWLGNEELRDFFWGEGFGSPVRKEMEAADTLEPVPVNRVWDPSLIPPPVSNRTMEKAQGKLKEFLAGSANPLNLLEILHFIAIVGASGNREKYDWHDYYLALDALDKLEKTAGWKEYQDQIVGLSDYIFWRYVGCDWEKWDEIKRTLSPKEKMKFQTGPRRPLSLFEAEIESCRLPKGSRPQDYEIVKVKALAEGDGLASLPTDPQDERVKLGRKAIEEGKIPSLVLSGGTSTSVKETIGAHKLTHRALKIKTAGKQTWISITHARLGLLLGQSRGAKVVVVTSCSPKESDKSIRKNIEENYRGKLESGQIQPIIQRMGLVLNPDTGVALRYKDGHIVSCAENHLWALLSVFADKDLIIELLETTEGILSFGNGDNILNYVREGMVSEIERARRENKGVATVAVCVPSAGDRKGGFAAEVTYRNKKTGRTFTQREFREISEFPTRGREGFKAIKLETADDQEFYQQCEQKGWFIEDIFGEKKVAFNIAFYALDLRLFFLRIFGVTEITELRDIDKQTWVDKIKGIGNNVPATIKPDKKVPNEDNTDTVTGYITEQAVQDFIVNSLNLLGGEGEAALRVEIFLAERKDVFLPYKGTKQAVLDEEGKVVEGEADQYDLLANMPRYTGVIRELSEKGHHCVLDEKGAVIEEVCPVSSLEEIREANLNF